MTKVKFCGLRREQDIDYVNQIRPDYIGFIFAESSRRYVTPEKAVALRRRLDRAIFAVGVFVNAPPEFAATLIERGIIDFIQLHGDEDECYIADLRKLTDRPVIKAFRIKSERDVRTANQSTADYILLDSGGGTGNAFNWNLLSKINRKYFLAGGLGVDNVRKAVSDYRPYAVDVSSGIETDGYKDKSKMEAFMQAVRDAEKT